MIRHDLNIGWQFDDKTMKDFFDTKKVEYIPVKTAPNYPVIGQDDYKKYYFDYENGKDTNDGLAPTSSKKTLNEAGRIAEEYGADGVQLLFKADSVFVGNLTIGGFRAEENRPLIIDKYPTDNLKMPKFIGDDNVVKITVGNVRVFNLEITGKQAYRGIFCVPESSGVLKNVVVQDCYIHDINFDWIYDSSPQETDPDEIDLEAVCPEFKQDKKTYDRYFYRYYGGIIFLNETSEEMGASWFENVWILGNRVECVARTGITMYSKWSNKGGVGYGYNKTVDDTPFYNDIKRGIGYYVHKNIVFNDNYVDCAGGDGIVLSSAEDSFVERNTCYRANYLGRKNYWNAGIWVYNAKNCYFQYNEAAYTYMRHGSNDAQGFDLDNCCSDVYFQFNYCHHNEGGGLLLCNLATPIALYDSNGEPKEKDGEGNPVKTKIMGKWYNNYVCGNVFAYNGNPFDATRSAFITIAREVDYVYAINNTVIMRSDIEGQSLIHTEDESTNCYNHVYANNIFYAERKTDSVLTIRMMKDFVFDNNLYFNMGANVFNVANDKFAWKEQPKFVDTCADDGYENICRFCIQNKELHAHGKTYAVRLSEDGSRYSVYGKNFLGAFAETVDKK